MQPQSQLIKLIFLCVMLATVGNAWGERQFTRDDSSDDSSQQVDIDSWGDEERTDDSWTWFGMGYELRTPVSRSIATTGIRRSVK